MTLRAVDQFHIGIVVDDLESALAELTELTELAELAELLGYEWCDEVSNPTDVAYTDGEPFWAYHRHGNGLRIELVTRALQPTMEQCFSTGRVPGSRAAEGGAA